MSSEPIVSVIIPAYNAEFSIRQCLISVTNQTFDDIEVIVIDDGSTDSTAEIIQSVADEDSRVRFLRQKNQFAGVARNNGLVQATGDYLLFLDADDYIEPDMLEVMIRLAETHNVDIAICSSNSINEYSGVSYPSGGVMYLENERIYQRGEIADCLFHTVKGWAWDKLFKRSFVNDWKLSFQDISSTNDAGFVYMAMALANSFVATEKILVHHRVGNPDSIEGRRWKTWENGFLAAEAIRDGLQQHGLFDQYAKTFYRWFIDFSVWNIKTLVMGAADSYCQKFINEWLPVISDYIRTAPDGWDSYLDDGVWSLFSDMQKDQTEMIMSHLAAGERISELENKYTESEAELIQMKNTCAALTREIDEYQEKITGLQQDIAALQQGYSILQNDLTAVKLSRSYRVGRAITYIPRTIKDAIGR
jgi:glycosyltransferase involved in cell wall biosynthesis